ncbi:hypothetical protein GH714_016407 [Hevea brasiliensis]|uniref:ADP/ATP translocase n=1 Tax=Hevea brasiliensis TaxID=3981 RepID=A0A6A6N4T2_HEVBR|nr:hypothetical protein GH714_016407 [Hevea brasiliensis]
MLMSTIGSATAKKSMLEFQLLRVARELIFDAETDKLFCPCLAHRFGAALASYPIDTVPRGMMMTSGEAAKYKSSLDAFSQILKNEGAKSLFKVVEANILRANADAGVLAGYDKLHLIVFGKKHRSGSVKLSL